MSKPVQDLNDVCKLGPLRQGRTVDHQDRQAQSPRRLQLGARAGAAGVLGHNQLRTVTLHQRTVFSDSERSSRNDRLVVGQRHCVRFVHQPKKIVVLGLGSEVLQMHATNGQEHTPGRTGQRVNRRSDIRDVLPGVTLLRVPGRSCQRSQWRRRRSAGHYSIAAHLRSKRMGRVYDMADRMIADIARQSFCTTEPAHACWHGLRARGVNAASIGVGGRNALLGYGFCQSIRLGRTTKNQEVGHV